jgi:hypothetical protein
MRGVGFTYSRCLPVSRLESFRVQRGGSKSRLLLFFIIKKNQLIHLVYSARMYN